MSISETELLNRLVCAAGFSRRNANIALQMYKADSLSITEKEVITKLMEGRHVPNNVIRDRTQQDPVVKYKVLNELNYRISQEWK